jgi:hypothetical protein
MKSFIADPKDGTAKQGCNTCCCAPAHVQPGSSDKWSIDYASWCVPALATLTARTRFVIETKEAERDPNAPTNTNYWAHTLPNMTAGGNVAAGAVEPNAQPLAFFLVPFFEPEHGKVTLNQNTGAFSYTPSGQFTGYDRFYVETRSSGGKVVTEVLIKVGPADMPDQPATPAISICGAEIEYGTQLTFALSVAPSVQVGDAFRLTVRQPARDCDCREIAHTSCYDIHVTGC